MNQTKPTNMNHNNMNHNMTSDYYFHNNVKFTGSAIESPSDVMTTLIYLLMLIMMALNAWPN